MKKFSQFKSVELMQQLTEARLWAEYTVHHNNPALRQVGIFLTSFYEFEWVADIDQMLKMDEAALSPLEIYETESWVLYFKHHSLEGLREVSEHMPQWIDLNQDA